MRYILSLFSDPSVGDCQYFFFAQKTVFRVAHSCAQMFPENQEACNWWDYILIVNRLQERSKSKATHLGAHRAYRCATRWARPRSRLKRRNLRNVRNAAIPVFGPPNFIEAAERAAVPFALLMPHGPGDGSERRTAASRLSPRRRWLHCRKYVLAFLSVNFL